MHHCTSTLHVTCRSRSLIDKHVIIYFCTQQAHQRTKFRASAPAINTVYVSSIRSPKKMMCTVNHRPRYEELRSGGCISEEAIYKLTPCLKKRPNFGLLELWHTWMDSDFFGRSVNDKVGNQKTLYCATSRNLCFCTTWQNGETQKSHFSLSRIVLHAQCTCALPSWKEKLSHVMCLIESDICWDNKISHQYCPLTFTPGLTKNNSHLLHSDWHRDRLG